MIPFFIKASIMALEHGAQHVWRRTVVSPPGAWIDDVFFFFIVMTVAIVRLKPRHLCKDRAKLRKFAPT